MSCNADPSRTKPKQPFGIPEELVQHCEEKGIAREELQTMEFEEVLKRAGKLSTKVLHRTLITVLKTSKHVDGLKKRLELLVDAPKIYSSDPHLQIINSVMHIHELDLCASKEELLEFAWTRALECEVRAAKMVSRFVIEHTEMSHEEIVQFIEEKWASLFPMEVLFSPAMKGHMSARLDLLTLIAKKATSELPFWPQTLSLYKEVKEQFLPMESLRAFGWTVLKTHKDQAAKEAFVLYTRAMKRKVFDFKYMQLFIILFANNHADLRYLLHYALTETRVGGSILCDIGVSHIPLSVFSEALQKISPEKINIRTLMPVIKNMIKKEKKEANRENLLEIQAWVSKLREAFTNQPLEGILLNIHSLLDTTSQPQA
ncbi:hypothetical protein NECID01_1225 [Nematocida sp. AWRm77]|nr:hypothetical protein NECID01_1225 [Nematocida sp. AWRm77]